MKTFLCGLTKNRNVAVITPAREKCVLPLGRGRTSDWVNGATFPDAVADTPIEADTALEAACRFAGVDPLERLSIGEATAWNHQRFLDRKRNEQHTLAFIEQRDAERARRTAEAAALTIGQLKQRVTEKQFAAILRAARRNNTYRNIGSDPFIASALGDKLRGAVVAKRQQRQAWAHYQPKPRPKTCPVQAARDPALEHPLPQRLLRYKHSLALKRADALAKRRAPLHAFILHVARNWYRHDGKFGRAGDGIVLGHGHGNTGTKKRGGPGTRCAAGVTSEKGKIHFWPTHGAKSFNIPLPPAALRKRARPGVAHPDGLFCVDSAELPGVQENWDFFAWHGQPCQKNQWRMVGYSIRGVRVPDNVARGHYSLDEALTHPNTELRRIMLERLPAEAVAEKLQVVHSDDFGTLYTDMERRDWRRFDNLTFVKVVNSTPEPDGSFKDYFLRVPGDMRTAKQAVAWTFGLTEEQYQPTHQS